MDIDKAIWKPDSSGAVAWQAVGEITYPLQNPGVWSLRGLFYGKTATLRTYIPGFSTLPTACRHVVFSR